jgi:hypothetical protein
MAQSARGHIGENSGGESFREFPVTDRELMKCLK